MVARTVRDRKAASSNLATPTTRKNLQARSARKCKNVRHEFIRERTFLHLRRMRSICKFDAVSFGWNHPNPTREPHKMCGFLYVNVARRNCPVTLHGGGGRGRYSNALPRAELPVGSFLGIQCSAPLHGAFSFTPTATRKREPWGRGRGAVVMLPHDVRELPYAPFWGLNAAHREDGVFSFTPTATRKREPWA